MDQVIIVGCDLHAKTLVLKLALGCQPAESLTLANTGRGREKLIALLRRRAADTGGSRVAFAYEASSQGFGLCDQLSEAGFECHVLAPSKIARSPKQLRDKGDHKDAEQIFELVRAHVLAGNSLPDVWIPDRQTRDDRERVRARLDAADKFSALKTQLKSLLARHQLVRPENTGKGWTRLFVAWLRGLTERQLGPGSLVVLSSLIRQMEFYDAELRRLDRELVWLANQPRYVEAIEAMCQLQGVGVLTALVFVTEIGEPRRFSNRRQVAAFLGLAPSRYESGSRSDCKGHITRQGPARVRKVLCQATWSRIRCQNPDQAAYRRIAAKNPKHKKIAVVAGMRRLAIRLWHVAHVTDGKQDVSAGTAGSGTRGPSSRPQTPTPFPLLCGSENGSASGRRAIPRTVD